MSSDQSGDTNAKAIEATPKIVTGGTIDIQPPQSGQLSITPFNGTPFQPFPNPSNIFQQSQQNNLPLQYPYIPPVTPFQFNWEADAAHSVPGFQPIPLERSYSTQQFYQPQPYPLDSFHYFTNY